MFSRACKHSHPTLLNKNHLTSVEESVFAQTSPLLRDEPLAIPVM
jgi:hypothetical protein